MVEISEDLKEIVSSTIESIKEGMKGKGCGVAGTIKFELSVIKGKSEKGGIRFFIAEIGGNYSSESVSKIRFEVGPVKTLRGPEVPFLWLTEST